MKNIISILLLMSVLTYGEELSQLKAKVEIKDNKIEIKILENSRYQRERKEIRHKIEKGETLTGIAKKYSSFFRADGENKDIHEIIKIIQKNNKNIQNINLIYVGDILMIRK